MPAPLRFTPPEQPMEFQRGSRVEFLVTLEEVDPDTLAPTGNTADLSDVTSVRAVLRRGRDASLPAEVTFTATVVSPATGGTVRCVATKEQMARVSAGEGYVVGVRTDEATDGPFDGIGLVVGEVIVINDVVGAP